MKITVGLAQIYPKIGDVRANLDKHLKYIDQADKTGVDLLIFPELSMTGYQVQDLLSEVALRPTRDDATFRALLDASKHMDIMFGFVHEDTRQRYYIAAA
jgi:predicted amidohydrolase